MRTPGSVTVAGILFLLSLFVHAISFSQEGKVSLVGKLKNSSTSKTVYLGGAISEALPIGNDQLFSWTGTIEHPGFVFINTDNSYTWGFWAEEGSINMTIEEYVGEGMDSTQKKLLRITSITGPPETEKHQWFVTYRNEVNRRLRALPVKQRIDSATASYYSALEEYIIENPGSKMAAHLINMGGFDSARTAKLLSLLDNEANADAIQSIEKDLARRKLLQIGNTIDDFQQRSVQGGTFVLSRLNRKFVLLEFWSSDCLPCRAANPALKKVYNQFQKKGFEIVGISLDNSKKEWKKAINTDKLPWIQVCDLKGWNNALASKYLISAIPFNILIDANRKILATNLTPSALENRLSLLFAGK